MYSGLGPILRKVFNILCFMLALFWTYRCLKSYLDDDDVVLVHYKQFHQSPSAIYPSITICLSNPFAQEKVFGDKEYSVAEYLKVLRGYVWNEKLANLDYDNVTINLDDYLKEYRVVSQFDTVYDQDFTEQEQEANHALKRYTITLRSPLVKCFTFDTSYKEESKINAIRISLDTKVFTNKRRPTSAFGSGDRRLIVALTYPKQLTRCYSSAKMRWPNRSNDSSINYQMHFAVTSMDVVKYRNKRKDPCIENWKAYDIYVQEELIKTAGCNPSQWKYESELPKCSRKDQLALILDKFDNVIAQDFWNYNPCQMIRQIQYKYEEVEEDNASSITLNVDFIGLDSHYKEIRRIKAYTFESFFGNAGGFFGIFVGYSILGIPDLVVTMISILQRAMHNKKDKHGLFVQSCSGERSSDKESTYSRTSSSAEILQIKQDIEHLKTILIHKGKFTTTRKNTTRNFLRKQFYKEKSRK